MTEETDNKTRLAFVDVFVKTDGAIRGGVLVTDLDTKPFEFRVTSPVKPTQLQVILYGRTLKEHLFAELICVPLLKQLKETISLVICTDSHLLLARPNIQIPMVVIKKAAGNTIAVQTHPKFSGEQTQAEFLVNALIKGHDIFEPFKRIETAVDEVHRQKIDQK